MTVTQYFALSPVQLVLCAILVYALKHLGLTALTAQANAAELLKHMNRLGGKVLPLLVVLSLLFAKVHATKGYALPLPQLISGLWFWYGAVHFGLWASFFVHLGINAILVSMALWGIHRCQTKLRELTRLTEEFGGYDFN